eukprot:2843407-Pleurochrysis_carterae.AAC.1
MFCATQPLWARSRASVGIPGAACSEVETIGCGGTDPTEMISRLCVNRPKPSGSANCVSTDPTKRINRLCVNRPNQADQPTVSQQTQPSGSTDCASTDPTKRISRLCVNRPNQADQPTVCQQTQPSGSADCVSAQQLDLNQIELLGQKERKTLCASYFELSVHSAERRRWGRRK